MTATMGHRRKLCFWGWGYADADARKIGANIVSYVTAMREAGQSIGKSVELVNADKRTAGKFHVGQIIHDGQLLGGKKVSSSNTTTKTAAVSGWARNEASIRSAAAPP